jgi:hypothetical protein
MLVAAVRVALAESESIRPNPSKCDLWGSSRFSIPKALGARFQSLSQSGQIRLSQTIGRENGVRPHPYLLPLGEGIARAALGVTDELAETASQGQSKPVKPEGFGDD